MTDRAILRIIDANANRAAEALRTLEDTARFALDHSGLSGRCKELRHSIRQALTPIDSPPGSLLAARDTPGDRGTALTAESETSRADLLAINIAAGKRLAESLRVLEETLKTLPGGPAAAAAVKQLRYSGYDLEQHIVLALRRRCRAPQWPLCVLITESLCTSHTWDEVARRAIRGGAECIQLREKSLSDRVLLQRASGLVEIARSTPLPGAGEHRAAIIINDRVDIALASGAAGVHLGQDDLPIAAARRIAFGVEGFLVGVSTASLVQARKALDDGADYLGLGPMYTSNTKPKDQLAGISYLREYLKLAASRSENTGTVPSPHLAISGITPANARELAAAGCRGIAVSSCVCGSLDPERVCRELIAIMSADRAA